MISSLIFTVAGDTCFAGTCAKSASVGSDLLRGGGGSRRRGGRFGIHVGLVSFVTRSIELIH